MTERNPTGPKVPLERPDPKAANREPAPGAQDRPGFDLGGSVDENEPTDGSNATPGGPKGSTSQGTTADGRAGGLTDPAGSRPCNGGSDSGGSI